MHGLNPALEGWPVTSLRGNKKGGKVNAERKN